MFKGASDIIKLKEIPKQKIVDRLVNAIAKLRPLVELPGIVINIKKLKRLSFLLPLSFSSKCGR